MTAHSDSNMTVCTFCGAAKPSGDYYASRRNACKECVKQAARAYYRANREHYVQYDQRREQDPDRKDSKREALRRYRTKNPIKNRARVMLNNAVRDGRIVRGTCTECGTTERVHAHHSDYNRPFDVEWLCKDCHWRQHGSVKGTP